MKLLKEYFDHFIKLSDEEWEQLSSLFVPVSFKKGEHIYSQSETSDAIYFITEGIVRSYKLEEDGKDFTWRFYCLDMDVIEHRMLMDIAVVDYVSFTQNTPEELAFEVLVDATLFKVSKDSLQKLFNSSIRWKTLEAKMAQDSYAILRQRAFTLLTKPAKQRLQLLLDYYPRLFEKSVNTEHIASYLGIARQSLNRLKKELI